MKKRHLWTLFPKNLIKIEFYTNIKMAFLKFHLFWPLMNFSQLISYWALIYMNKQCLNNIPWVCTISESKNPLWPTVKSQMRVVSTRREVALHRVKAYFSYESSTLDFCSLYQKIYNVCPIFMKLGKNDHLKG